MCKRIIIYREQYASLPKRFVDKIDSDIEYIQKADIPGLKGVYLFGSCAAGRIRSKSDVDLLILTDKKIEDRALASSLRWDLDEELCGVSTDVVYMNLSSVNEKTVFKNLINKEKKLILEVIE